MKIGRVIGTVWSERKVPVLKGCRLHLVQPLRGDDTPAGQPLVVADPGHLAGPGDRIVFVTSTDATRAFESGFAPVNAAVVELVDSID